MMLVALDSAYFSLIIKIFIAGGWLTFAILCLLIGSHYGVSDCFKADLFLVANILNFLGLI